ncbi:GNAT family N-acetyltransferase [Pseudalkalibacillus sp. A8]|uniref:GNAT family N-acetyltransferase n=1 Tax=Pseudalkalibacillus sp. A8 TaxID=3382641 RepID=UPI0038B447E3
MNNIKGINPRSVHDFQPFSRDQVWYKENDQYAIKTDHFIEDWDENKKRLVLQELRNSIQYGGIVAGSFSEAPLIGFASVEGEFFGSNDDYLELSYIHVSNEYRNKGVGNKLFKMCCAEAKQKGAYKLYIAAHLSIETQHFYISLGCSYVKEINQNVFERTFRSTNGIHTK